MYQVTLKNVEANTIIHAVSSEKNAPKINGTLKKGINVIDEFTCKIKPNNIGFNLIRPFKTLIEVLNTKNNTIEFIGRVLMPVPSMGSDGVIESTVVCESELAYLHDTNTRHGEFHDISVEDFLKMLINNHNAHTTEDKWFEVGKVEVIDKIYRFTSYDQTTFESIKDNLLDRLGGEILIRYENNKRYLDYVLQAGKKSSVDIRLSKNLISFTREVDPTQVATLLLGPDCEAYIDRNTIQIRMGENSCCVNINTPIDLVGIEDVWLSPCYGKKMKTKAIKIRGNSKTLEVELHLFLKDL